MLLSKCVRWRPWALALVIQLAGWNVWALDLSQVWQLALNNDPGFKAALATEEAAREGETQAKAMLLPNVSLSHVHNQVSLQQSLGGTTTPYNYHSQNSGLSVRQSLFRKPQWDQLDQSREQIKAAQAELQRAQLDLLFRTSGYYFEMLFAKDVLEFNKTNVVVRPEGSEAKYTLDISEVHNCADAHNYEKFNKAVEKAKGWPYQNR
jgi:outer membrane protein